MDAGTQLLLHGQAYVEVTETDDHNNRSRPVDNSRQIETTFYINPETREMRQFVFVQEGMPKIYLMF